MNSKGKTLELTAKSGYSLLYDMKTKSWYYKSVTSSQKIDITTMKVVKS